MGFADMRPICSKCGLPADPPYVGQQDHAYADKCIGLLRAEVAALRKDADRYRGLREMPQFFGWDADYRPDEIDTQVDAALAAKEGT